MMRQSEKLKGEIYNMYSEVNGCDPTILLIQQWNTISLYALKIEHEKLKEKYETKIRIQNE